MRLCSLSVFLSSFTFATALLLAQTVMAIEPGPITPKEAKVLIQQKGDLVILDVRTPSEYVAAHYPNALNIPIDELETRISEVPTGKPVLMHCAIGKRAEYGYGIMKAKRPDIKKLYYIRGEPIFN